MRHFPICTTRKICWITQNSKITGRNGMKKINAFRISTGFAAALCAMAVFSGCGGGAPADDAAGADAAPAFKLNPYANAEAGEKNFMMVCSACHGKDAMGLPNLGKQLVRNEYLKTLSDAEFYDLLLSGRGPEHPLNTTGVAMPPKGGNPAFAEKDLHSIILYVRTLSQ